MVKKRTSDDLKIMKLPQPDELTQREKDDAMGAYLMMFAGWGVGLPIPFFGLIASIIYYFINRKKSDFTGFHALQALYFHIPVSVLNGILVIWGIVLLVAEEAVKGSFVTSPSTKLLVISAIFVGIWNIIYLVISIVACVSARKGNFYYVPLFGRMAFNVFYGAQKQKIAEKPNLPPGF